MSRFQSWLRIALLSAVQLAIGVTLSAQTPPPPQTVADDQPPAVEKQESFEEKWLKFSNRALTAQWGWMLLRVSPSRT